MDLRETLLAFRKTIWFRVIYLVVISLILVALFPLVFGAAACLIVILMPVVMFAIPYWLGERRARNILLNGLVMFVIASLILAAVQTQGVLGIESVELNSLSFPGTTPRLSLANGTVEPLRADPPATVTFRVRLTWTGNATPGDFLVWTNLTSVAGLSADTRPIPMQSESPANATGNASWYRTSAQLGGSIFLFSFSAATGAQQNWTFTPAGFGPITASFLTFYGFFVYFAVSFYVLPLVLYFSIVFMWWYSRRLRETRQRMYKERLAKMESEKVAPAAPPTATMTCTNCGADVDERATKCPKCGAVFED